VVSELIAGCIGFIIGGGMGILAMAMMAVASKADDVLLKEDQYNGQ
jgi:hypothetical protein